NFGKEAWTAKPGIKSERIVVDDVLPLEVTPSTSATISARITSVQPDPANAYPVEVTFDGGHIWQRCSIHESVATRGTPKIDGDLTDWSNAKPLYLNSSDQAVGINPWMDWNISAIYYLMWDQDNLYFAARVRDNVHAQPYRGQQIWEGDSWQLGFDTAPET